LRLVVEVVGMAVLQGVTYGYFSIPGRGMWESRFVRGE
jgi:hypothetical protein